MKRLLVRFGVAVGLLAAPLAMVSGGPAGADPLPVAGVVDLTVSLSAVPSTVSPPGAGTVWTATVDQGVVAVPGNLTITLPSGSSFIGAGSSSSCSATGTTVSCAFPAAKSTIKVAASTPTTTVPAGGTDYTATAVVAATPGPGTIGGVPLADVSPYEYSSNNTASATVHVNPPASADSATGYVAPGDSIHLHLADGRDYTLTVPNVTGQHGVIVTIEAANDVCTSVLPASCTHDGFKTTFQQGGTGEAYASNDPDHPLVTVKTFGPQDPCMGIGGTCSGIYWSKDGLTPYAPEPYCNGAGPGGSSGDGTVNGDPTSPCVNHKYKVSGLVTWDVRILSNDPIELPIGKLGA